MLDGGGDEDQKVFHNDTAGQEIIVDQADPDEIMEFNTGEGRIWLVKARQPAAPRPFWKYAHVKLWKVPKFLMERWEKILAPDVHLATMRVFDGGSKISLLLPQASRLGTTSTPQLSYQSDDLMTEYTLEVVNPGVENQVVISEQRTESPNGRASMFVTNSLKLWVTFF
jgi:transcription initiation factor TFIIF subunit beta